MEITPAPAASNPYGLSALVQNGDMISHGVLIVLAIMSFFSWYIMLTKVWDQRKLKQSAKIAEKQFWTAPSLKDGVERLKKGDDFRAIAEDGLRAAAHHDGRLTDRIDLNEWITMSLQRSVNNVTGKLQTGLGFLATVGSTAPFVGLFGTVVGIINALVVDRPVGTAQHRSGSRPRRRGADHDRARPHRGGAGRAWLQLAAGRNKFVHDTICGTLRAICMPSW